MALVIAPSLPAMAQDDDAPPPQAQAQAGDTAARPGVARIAAIRGQVTITRADSNDPVVAVLNAPVLGADYVSTGEGARTELQLDARTAVRLDENTQMRFTSLDPETRELQIAVGTLDLGLFGSTHVPQIDTPTVSVRPSEGGRYRVTVTQDGQTEITVRRGSAEVISPQGTQEIHPGNTLLALGSAENPTISIVQEVAIDDFDRYAAARNEEIRVALGNSVTPNVEGGADLDQVGTWQSDPQYGRVWVPPTAQDPNWAPYQNGNWAWEDAYGWTWVAAEPWGWAPYHYGRWYHSPAFGWAWYPPSPRIAAAYVYQPALVAFVGFNIGAVRVGLGFGNIGWVPLAPAEIYHPWYGGYGYGRNVTNVVVTNNYTRITNYRNARYAGAVTAVSTTNFGSGNFRQRVAVDRETLASARPLAGAIPVVPSAANLRFSANASAAYARPIVQRSFSGNPVAVQRTAFGAQRQAVASATHAAYTPDPRYPASGRTAQYNARYGGESAPARTGSSYAPSQPRGAAGAEARPAPSYAKPNPAWDRFDNRGAASSGAQAAPSMQRAPNAYQRSTPAQTSRPYYNGGTQSQQGHGYGTPSARSQSSTQARPSYAQRSVQGAAKARPAPAKPTHADESKRPPQ
jgi:hypothetical protein